MTQDHSQLNAWLDESFFRQGAFLTIDGEDRVLLGKGGTLSESEFFDDEGAFYLKDFYTDKYLVFKPTSFLETSLSALRSVTLGWPTESFTFEEKTEDDIYAEDFKELSQAFGAQLKKVVLISRAHYNIKPTPEKKRSLFARAFSFGTGLPYGFWSPSLGLLGSTPELLYKITGERLQTFALAGTAKTGEEDLLLSSKKDQEEHALVIRNIKEELSSFVGNISSGQQEIAQFKKLIHLKTPIEASLQQNVDLKALTDHLSPTAALGGYPKSEALKFLAKTKYAHLHPGRFFGSAFGVCQRETKQFVVMIRNVEWDQHEFYIESGGGVLPESELQKELQEIRLKRQTIREHYLS